MPIKSILEAGVKALPDNFKRKAQSLPSAFKKMGVKDEELEFSGIMLDEWDPQTKVPKKDLEMGVQWREDSFGVLDLAENERTYQQYSLEEFIDTPTYRERVYTFDTFESSTSIHPRYKHQHFPEVQNYLMHTRSVDSTIEGEPTRVVMEIQSDLHQTAKKIGKEAYDSSNKPVYKEDVEHLRPKLDEIKRLSGDYIRSTDEYEPDSAAYNAEKSQEILEELHSKLRDLRSDDTDLLEMLGLDGMELNALANLDFDKLTRFIPPRSPYESTWLIKALERETVQAYADGRKQIAIPISDPSIRKYKFTEDETKILEAYDNLTPISENYKQIVKDFSELAKAKNISPEDEDSIFMLSGRGAFNYVSGYDRVQSQMERGAGVQRWYENTVVPKVKSWAKKNGFTAELKTTSAANVADLHPNHRRNFFLEMVKAVDKNNGDVDLAMEQFDRSTIRRFANSTDSVTIRKYLEAIADSTEFSQGQMPTKLRDQFNADPAITVTNTGPSTNYLVIKPKQEPESVITEGQKEYKLHKTFPLYAAGGFALVDPTQEAQAGESSIPTTVANLAAQGYSEQDIVDALKAEADNLGLIWRPELEQQIRYNYNHPEIVPPQMRQTATDVPPELVEQIQTAMADGVTPEEMNKVLADRHYDQGILDGIYQATQDGVPADEILQVLVPDYAPNMTQQTKQDDSPAEIASTKPVAQEAYKRMIDGEIYTAEELVANLQVINPNMASVWTRTQAWWDPNSEEYRAAHAAERAANAKIIELAKQHGLNFKWQPAEDGLNIGSVLDEDVLIWVKDDGTEVEVTPGVWDSIQAEGYEIAGAVGGGVAGVAGGVALAGLLASNPAGWLVAALGAAGGVLGAAGGAAAGSSLDYLRHSVFLYGDLQADVLAHKAFTAAEASVFGDIAVGAGFATIKPVFKTFKFVKQAILNNNIDGAIDALVEVQGITRDEAEIQVAKLARVITVDKSNAKEDLIRAAVLSMRGGQDLAKAANFVNPASGGTLRRSIDARSAQIEASVNNLASVDSMKLVRQDLVNYEQETKLFYNQVKNKAAVSPGSGVYAFDFDSLAIQPVLDRLSKGITDPALSERFMFHAQKIRDMNGSRSFADLIELRQLINDYRFNKKISRADDKQMLNDLVGRIDDEIGVAARITMEQPDEWLADFAAARAEYSKMKKLQGNVIYRILTRKGINPDTVVKGMKRYINDIDGSFVEAMDALPKQARQEVEGSITKHLTDKFTKNVENLHAVDFVNLDKELQQVPLITKEARKYREVVSIFSDIFKNDVGLLQAAKGLHFEQEGQSLTANLLEKARFYTAGKIWNNIRSRLPTQAGDVIALARNAGKVLENPMNQKSVNELMAEIGDDLEVQNSILQMQEEFARARAAGSDVSQGRLHFAETTPGKFRLTDGGPERIPKHRIASSEHLNLLAREYSIDPNDTKAVDAMLKRNGYLYVQEGTDTIRRLK